MNLETVKRERERKKKKKSIELTELPGWRGFQRHSLVCGVFCWGPRSWPAVLINFWKLGQGFLSKRCHPAIGASGNAGHWNSLGGRSWCGWHPGAWGKKASKEWERGKAWQKMGLVRKPSLNSRTIASWVPSVVKFHDDSLPGLWVTYFHAWKWPPLRYKVSVWGSFSFPFWDQEKDTPSPTSHPKPNTCLCVPGTIYNILNILIY